MKIINYNRKEKTLYVQYNTLTVWKYQGISIRNYNLIVTSKIPEKTLRKILTKLHLVGINKKAK
jgi:hypothetical protein